MGGVMKSLKSYGLLAFMLLWAGILLAACGGGGGSSGTTNVGAGTGGTLTFTGLSTVSTIPGLSYSALLSSTASNVGSTAYVKTFVNLPNTGEGALSYISSSTQDYLIFSATTNFNVASAVWYNAGTPAKNTCLVSGANPTAMPTCASWGIAASRVAGTITFASAPVYNAANTAASGTMSGALTFPPF